ncbi:DUF4172 domain-containing protein [Desulfovibrio sp. TomC]|uniref:DUF4172 domain-containing protein n=1 Tax=Desulfovibrio sp. TomC TaxID=1562888 RepID=UPI0005BCF5D6
MRKYIYDQADWPQFRWDAAALSRQLAEVRHRQGWLLGRMEGVTSPNGNLCTLRVGGGRIQRYSVCADTPLFLATS